MTPLPPSRTLTLAGYFSFILLGWNAVVIPAIIRSIENDFHQTDAGLGLLYLVKSVLFAIGAFGGGLLTERLGRRAVLLVGVLVPASGFAVAALVPGGVSSNIASWSFFIVANAAASWGTGIIDGGVNALFLDLYRDARGAALSFLHLFFSIGALVAPFLIGQVVGFGIDWRVIVALTATGFVILAVPLALTSMPSGRHRGPSEGDTPALQSTGEEEYPSERSLVPFIGLAIGIAMYTAAEIGVSSWLVRLLASVPLVKAAGVLSLFWGGLTLGRLLSRWVVERFDYTVFTVGSFALASLSLAGAAIVEPLLLKAVLFTLAGLFYGPIYPMIMALGGNVYPHRLAALSGSLTTAASLGVIIYPPLMGLLAADIGLRNGMIGAALLGLPGMVAISLARKPSVP